MTATHTPRGPRRWRRPADTVGSLIAGATHRRPFLIDDGKSGATLERVTVSGQPHVLKHVGGDRDWLARAANNHTCAPLRVWEAGLTDQLPDGIDHAIVGCARTGPDRGAILMQDVSRHLVPAGHDPLALRQHRQFLDHMAALHARFFGFVDDVGLVTMTDRCLLFSPRTAQREIDRGGGHPIPTRLVPRGWKQLARRSPALHRLLERLIAVPAPLVGVLASTPTTLLHGDWKAGNLGTSDRRTILLDWAIPGAGPGCLDLTHYLALNARRLPEPKEQAATAYRLALERRGVTTDGWWDRQLDLSILATTIMFAWEKAGDHDTEFRWWRDRALAAADRWL